MGQKVIEQFFTFADINLELLLSLGVKQQSVDVPQTLSSFPFLVFSELLKITPHLLAVFTVTLHHLHLMNTHKWSFLECRKRVKRAILLWPMMALQKPWLLYLVCHTFLCSFPQPWASVSNLAKDFIQRLLLLDPTIRLTADQAIQHPWVVTMAASSSMRNLHRSISQNLRQRMSRSSMRCSSRSTSSGGCSSVIPNGLRSPNVGECLEPHQQKWDLTS